MDRIVGVGEIVISNNEEDKIKTFALASCVAITVYSPKKSAAGMIHIALPSTGLHNREIRPCYFADTGVPLLIEKMCSTYKCNKNELEINLFGGANSIRIDDIFNIGQKNLVTVKNVLSNLNLKYIAVEVGREISRTLELDVGTGKVKVTTQPIII